MFGALRHPSLRLKITAVFSIAMAVLLAAISVFVYASFQAGLDRSIDRGLQARANDIRALVMQTDNGLAQADRLSSAGVAQVVAHNGRVLDATPGLPRQSLLGSRDLMLGAQQTLRISNRYLSAVHDTVRLLASPVDAQGQHLVIIAGTSLRDRASALADLRAVLLLGGPMALILASVLGYAALAASLRSVEAIRQQAGRLSVEEPGPRLPVPRSGDELTRLAETLNDMLARNEAAFQRERQLVADAGHELRSPLAILRAELEVALDGNGSAKELRGSLASAADEAARLGQLADDLLTIAQADEGHLPLDTTSVSVRLTFDRIRHRFSQRAAAADRMIVASNPGELILSADPLRVEQALTNLVDNALRHGAGDIVLFADRVAGGVELHVADSGPGFPPGFIDSAFERFTQPQRGRVSVGAGLGLSIVRRIARAHGGEAHVANRPSGGADAWLSLPAATAPVLSSETQAVNLKPTRPGPGPARPGLA